MLTTTRLRNTDPSRPACTASRSGAPTRRAAASLLLLLSLLLTAGSPASGSAGPASPPYGSPGLRLRSTSVPEGLIDIWIRFHETELCQELDSVWHLHEKGMEVWCAVEEDKDYQKFLDLVDATRASYTVDLYATRPGPDEKSVEDRHPPPSIWNNAEVRNFLQDPFTRSSGQTGLTVRPQSRSDPDGEYFLKQRMLMFAEQTLEWEVKMKRYAADLPGLAEVSFSANIDPGLRTRALEACLAHAKGVDKYAEKLGENLLIALPKASRRFRPREKRSRESVLPPPRDTARQVSSGARSIARRVYRFIHPEQHTVGLIDLREPSLLESLKTLRRMVSDFETSVRKAR